jgi:hypothetical protein
MRTTIRFAVAALLLGVCAPGALLGQEASQSQSALAAGTLVRLLGAQGLQAVAAKDPDDPGRFIAALYIPGAELLVVSATYPVPSLLEQRLHKKEYRDVYLDLQATPTTKGRLFIEDMQSDGLKPTCPSGVRFDVAIENGTVETRFNGDFAAQKLTEGEYRSRFEAVEARYAKMLSALIAAVRPTT